MPAYKVVVSVSEIPWYLVYMHVLTHIMGHSFFFIIIIIIIIKKDWQCKAGRGRLTPYQSEDPSPTLPTYRGKEERGKIVEEKNGESPGEYENDLKVGVGLICRLLFSVGPWHTKPIPAGASALSLHYISSVFFMH